MVINGAGVVGHYLESLFILLQHFKLPLKASFMAEVVVRAEEAAGVGQSQAIIAMKQNHLSNDYGVRYAQ